MRLSLHRYRSLTFRILLRPNHGPHPCFAVVQQGIEVLIPPASYVSEEDIEWTVCGKCSVVIPNTHEDVW